MNSGCIDHGCKGFGLGYATAYYKGVCGKKRFTTKHRIVYCKHKGIHPESLCKTLVVRHKCDNARCINPEHLEVGTHQDNMDDMTSRGRNYTFPPKFGEDNPRSKVKDKEIVEIRDLRMYTKFSYREIGELYGIGISQVSRICKGESREKDKAI